MKVQESFIKKPDKEETLGLKWDNYIARKQNFIVHKG